MGVRKTYGSPPGEHGCPRYRSCRIKCPVYRNSPVVRSKPRKLYDGAGSGLSGNGRPTPGLKHDHLFAGVNSMHVQPYACRFSRVARCACAVATRDVRRASPVTAMSAVTARRRALVTAISTSFVWLARPRGGTAL